GALGRRDYRSGARAAQGGGIEGSGGREPGDDRGERGEHYLSELPEAIWEVGEYVHLELASDAERGDHLADDQMFGGVAGERIGRLSCHGATKKRTGYDGRSLQSV